MLRKIVPAMALLLFAGTASATTFTASGTAGGQTIDAQAVFTFNNLTPDVMTVTLTNLLPNPTSVGQNITDFDFQLLNSLGQTITPTCTTNCLTSASATKGSCLLHHWAASARPRRHLQQRQRQPHKWLA